MGFGGSVSAMLSSLKNNKRTRPSAFKKLKNIPNGVYKDGSIDKKATPKQLRDIRNRIQEENKRALLKRGVIFTIILAVIIYFIGFHKF